MNDCIHLENRDFESYGLNHIAENIFQKRNLLIGKNGVGKTRFLHARLDGLKRSKPEDTVLIFLDFSSFHINGRQNRTQEDQDSNVYDLLFNDVPVDFLDLLNVIDSGNESMIEDLLVQLSMRAPTSRNRASNRLERINEQLRDLLGYTVIYDNNEAILQKLDSQGNVIRQKKYSEMVNEFSPGERMVFNLTFFIFYLNEIKQKKLILLMDEPELHLHPQVLLRIISWLYVSSAIDELWVASHSLFLVPQFQFNELVLFDSNQIAPRNSDTYKKLYNELVGLKNINLFEFLKSLDNWQYYNFLVECFCHPTAVSKVNTNDEQFKEFVAALKVGTRVESSILDYGAGKFRIWDCLQESEALGENTASIKYEAYEPYLSDDEKEKRTIAKKHFPLYTSIEDIPRNKYDAVVLMNVLHEVDILDWVETFHNIGEVLKPDGVLILLEVRTLLLGEQPYGNTGYLILGDDEVSELFTGVSVTKYGPDRGKSNCWVIARDGVLLVDRDRVRASVEQLQKSSFHLLRELFEEKIELAHSEGRNSDKEISARKYAFWSQQYINAQLALERLAGSKKSIGKNGNCNAEQKNTKEKIAFPGLKNDL